MAPISGLIFVAPDCLPWLPMKLSVSPQDFGLLRGSQKMFSMDCVWYVFSIGLYWNIYFMYFVYMCYFLWKVFTVHRSQPPSQSRSICKQMWRFVYILVVNLGILVLHICTSLGIPNQARLCMVQTNIPKFPIDFNGKPKIFKKKKMWAWMSEWVWLVFIFGYFLHVLVLQHLGISGFNFYFWSFSFVLGQNNLENVQPLVHMFIFFPSFSNLT